MSILLAIFCFLIIIFFNETLFYHLIYESEVCRFMENKAPQLRAIFFYTTLLFGFLTMSYVNFQLSNFFNADIGGILLRLRVGVFLLPVFSMLVYFGTLIWKLQHKIWLFLQFFLLCLTVCLCVFLIAYPRVGGIPSPYQILSNSLISIWSLIGFSQCSKQIILFQNPPHRRSSSK